MEFYHFRRTTENSDSFFRNRKNKAEEAAHIISEESGKPFWEAKTEVNSLINKVQVVFDSFNERARPKTKELANGRVAITRYKPHGVMAVLGPFNFPMSMPNGCCTIHKSTFS